MLTFTLLVFGLAWTVKATPFGNHTCTGVVKHPVTVRVNVTEPVTFRTYTWCLRVPPRCSQYTIHLKDRIKIHTEMHNRTITVCCAGYVEIDYACVPACPPQTGCPNMHCNRTNHCYCTPGYTGLYCSQPCPKGSWGAACLKPCDCPTGYTCHHLTGDCMIDDSPLPKPKRTTVMSYDAEHSTLLTSFPSSSTSRVLTMASSSKTPYPSPRIAIQSTSTTEIPIKAPTTEIRLIPKEPTSTSRIKTSFTSSTPARSASAVTFSSSAVTTALPTATQTSATIPSTVTSATLKPNIFQELLTIPVISATPPITPIVPTMSTGLKKAEQSSILPEINEPTKKAETWPNSNFFAPVRPKTTPSLQQISIVPTVSETLIPRTLPTSVQGPTSILKTPTSITEEPIPSLIPASSSTGQIQTRPPTTPPLSTAVSSTSQTMPTTEDSQTTLFVPFWMKMTSPASTLSGLHAVTTVSNVTPKTPPSMHIISKTSDGRFILTNVVETSSNRNATTKKPPSFTSSSSSTLFNLVATIPSTPEKSVILKTSTDNFGTLTSTTMFPHIPERTKLIEDRVTDATSTPSAESPTSVAPTSVLSKGRKIPTAPSLSNKLHDTTPTTSAEPSTSQRIITAPRTTSTAVPRNAPTSSLVSLTPPKLTRIQDVFNASSTLEYSTSPTTTAGASDTIKTYLPKFNFDKDDSLEFTKSPQKPTKIKEKIQKKYKSKVDTSSTLSTSHSPSRKELDESLTNNIFLETTEFKVHLAATKNTDTSIRKATTKLDISEEDFDSSRPTKKKVKDKFVKVLEEPSSRPPITLFVSTSTGANAAHTWYSHMREKAKAKSNTRQQKSTTPVLPTETSPMPEESNDIDSLAAMYTAAQDSKNGNSLQDEFNLPHMSNLKFNSSMTYTAGIQAAQSSSFSFYSSITAVVGGCLVLLACLVLVTILLFRLRNKRRAANSNLILSVGDVRAYETVYPVHGLPASLEAVTFFCPTFTNNYAENMKREASEFNYDQPKSQATEPLYAEIRH